MTREDVETPFKAAKFAVDVAIKAFEGKLFEVPWFIDEDNLDEALEFFKIEWPIEIKIIERLNGAIGFYRCGWYTDNEVIWKTTQDHEITIYSRLSPEFASMALWHELKHAAQAEAYSSPFKFADAVYPKNCDNFSWIDYANIPAEVEAYKTAVNHFDLFPLTVKASGKC